MVNIEENNIEEKINHNISEEEDEKIDEVIEENVEEIIDENIVTNNDEFENLIHKISNIHKESILIKDRFMNRHKENENYQNDKRKMNITYEKDFKNHLQKKLNKLDNRLNILQMKYNNYKKWYDRFNIIIIIISSLLSIFEALRNQIDDQITEDTPFYFIFNMTPITISSTITCTAAIIKFKKYQEKMENMQFTREKVLLAVSRLKHVQESLWFSDHTQFDTIKKKYIEDVYNTYNESNSELGRHIKFNDHHKFFKMYKKPPEPEEKKTKNLLNII